MLPSPPATQPVDGTPEPRRPGPRRSGVPSSAKRARTGEGGSMPPPAPPSAPAAAAPPAPAAASWRPSPPRLPPLADSAPAPLAAALSLLRTRLLRGGDGLELEEALETHCCAVVSVLLATAGLSSGQEARAASETSSPNNSVLLLGPRGCGKSLVVARALERVQRAHPGRLVVVRLSGRVHADENVGVREMVAQLAATQSGVPGAPLGRRDPEPLSHSASLLRHIAEAGSTAVFVLDEFDLFSPAKGKQMLLYSLMDAVQASACRAVVLGSSCRTDAAELLEKRVRSRFSHRRIVFVKHEQEQGRRLLAQLLRLPSSFAFPDFAQRWNEAVEAAVRPRGAIEKELLQSALDWDSSPRRLAQLAFICVTRLEGGKSTVTSGALAQALHAMDRPSREVVLSLLGPTELHLLVAAVRLEAFRNRPTFNFAALFTEYKAALATLGQPSAPREVVQHSFDQLLQLALFEPADAAALAQAGAGRAAGYLKEHACYSLILGKAEVTDAVMMATVGKVTNLEHLLVHETAGGGGVVV